MFKKAITMIISTIMTLSFVYSTNITATYMEENFDDEIITYSFANLPQQVDLSTSPCFPPIGYQGNFGSCVAWATTYYQYSYEVNKLNNVTDIADQEIYSPYFVYNLNNGGRDQGIHEYQAYKTLENLGCLKLKDFNRDSYRVWPKVDTNDMRENLIEALKTRLVGNDKVSIPNNRNISSPSNLTANNIPLSNVKSLLNDGKVLVVGTKGYFNSAESDGECIAYRCYSETGESGHELTVVGYDNNLSYDVNGNGKIEPCEKGAFKVANSWGEHFNQNGIFSNNGYFWVMYDALNLNSTNTYNNWESSYNTTRYPAFSSSNSSDDSNDFHYITVDHKKVNLIGELKIEIDKKYGMDVYYNVRTGSQTSYTITNQTLLTPYCYETETQTSYFNSSIIFDFGNYVDDMEHYWNGYNYFVKISTDSSAKLHKTSFRLLDDRGNIIADYNENNIPNQPSNSYLAKSMNLQLGDLNYDGILSENDATFLMNILVGNNSPSNLQYALADCNQDGIVDISDVLSIRNSLSATSNLNELDLMIQTYTSENNIDISAISTNKIINK